MKYNYQAVEMPSKGVSINKSRTGTAYVYHIGKGYRNQYGKPTSKKALIGKLDPATGKLIPNDRYYELYPDQPIETIQQPAEIKLNMPPQLRSQTAEIEHRFRRN